MDLKKSLPSWKGSDQSTGQKTYSLIQKDLESILLRAYQAADATLTKMPPDILADEEKKFSYISKGEFSDSYFSIQEKIAHRLAGGVDYIRYLSQVYSEYVGGLINCYLDHKPRFGGNRKNSINLLVKSVLSDISVVMYHYFIHLNRQADEARAAAQAEREQRAQEDRKIIEVINEALSALAKGDLTYRIRQDMPDRADVLKQNFNSMAGQLADTMTRISTNTTDVMANADGIKQSADDLSRRTEQQAATLEETSAALQLITQRVLQTTEETQKAHNLVNTTQTEAARSSEIVKNTIDAINKVEDSSHQVSKIVDIINAISFQTNILALNASVEAARAGDVGRGFAVVAGEVRILAQRSADAGKEISVLISRSSSQVKNGVTLVREAGDALQRIASQVGSINELVSNISASASEQSTSITQLNTAMDDMQATTQKNAAIAEESAAASHNLSTMSDDLARLVNQFRLETHEQSSYLKNNRRSLSLIR